MFDYHKLADKLYSANPEGKSRMILTLVELWIACDQSAIECLPLLREYDPSVPIELLQSLLLPSLEDMVRLARAEEHVRLRCVRGTTKGSILQDFGQSHCFSVRYFDSSPVHRALLDEIVLAAAKDREAKQKELRDLKIQYQHLAVLFRSATCQYETYWSRQNGAEVIRHKSKCIKCTYKSQMGNIFIVMHEWPLPPVDLEAKSVVFELRVPAVFAAWREATFFLLKSILKLDFMHQRPIRPDTPGYAARSYTGLSRYYLSTATHRKQQLTV